MGHSIGWTKPAVETAKRIRRLTSQRLWRLWENMSKVTTSSWLQPNMQFSSRQTSHVMSISALHGAVLWITAMCLAEPISVNQPWLQQALFFLLRGFVTLQWNHIDFTFRRQVLSSFRLTIITVIKINIYLLGFTKNIESHLALDCIGGEGLLECQVACSWETQKIASSGTPAYFSLKYDKVLWCRTNIFLHCNKTLTRKTKSYILMLDITLVHCTTNEMKKYRK